jgi:hypothetical protein
MTSSIYVSINNKIQQKVFTSDNTNISIDKPQDFESKNSKFNLLKYNQTSSTFYFRFNDPENPTIPDTPSNITIKVNDLSGFYDKLDQFTDLPLPSFASVCYLRSIFYPQPETEKKPFVIKIFIFQKKGDSTWKIFVENGSKQFIIATNTNTDSIISIADWDQVNSYNTKTTGIKYDYQFYSSSLNNTLKDINDEYKIFVTNLDNNLPPFDLGGEQITYDDFNGIYTWQSQGYAAINKKTNKSCYYFKMLSRNNKNFKIFLYKPGKPRVTTPNPHWLFGISYQTSTSYPYYCPSDSAYPSTTGWIRTKTTKPNPPGGGEFPDIDKVKTVKLGIYVGSYSPSVIVKGASNDNFNGQYFLIFTPDTDSDKGDIVYKKDNNSYIINKNNNWILSSNGSDSVSTNTEINIAFNAAVPNSKWTSNDKLVVTGDMISTSQYINP